MTREEAIRKDRHKEPESLADDEMRVVASLQAALVLFSRLPDQARDVAEFRQSVRAAQNIIARRIFARADPETWG
jgi:hypothetical protein